MLRSHRGAESVGLGMHLSELRFKHHPTDEDLQRSATGRNGGCHLCRAIWNKTRTLSGSILAGTTVNGVRRYLSATLRGGVLARSGLYRERPQLYQLDFFVEGMKQVIASFVLKEQTDENQATARIAGTPTTSSSAVLQKAKKWIEDCAAQHKGCRPPPEPWDYPMRLLDLKEMLDLKKIDHEPLAMPPDLSLVKRLKSLFSHRDKTYQPVALQQQGRARRVRLVSQKKGEQRHGQTLFDGKYVTLSHCWGHVKFLKLTAQTLRQFQDGIPVTDLPRTFQDAIDFACILKVRWLWIDALCIIQDDTQDWLAESARMHVVYTNSYCNISATAAVDSSKGLFNDRDPNTSWVDTVDLKRDGLRADITGIAVCTILDLSFWQESVMDAPVNRRCWVFQERLLSPRVIHWCQNQIAFECRETDQAGCRPGSVPHYQFKDGNVIEDTRLKRFDVAVGKELRRLRLAGKRGTSGARKVEEIENKFYLFELWKRVVETYSKMHLSVEGDRLIALSGIARMMTSVLEAQGRTKDQYIAGMWRDHMASQLLWYVNEGNLRFEDIRTEKYRAPTFSWACVETTRGITFPETTENSGLLLDVETMRLTYEEQEKIDTYGRLTDGDLVVRGVLRRIELIDEGQPFDRPANWESFITSVDRLPIAIVVCGITITSIIVSLVVSIMTNVSGMLSWAICSSALAFLCLAIRRNTSKRDSFQQIHGQRVRNRNRYSWYLLKKGKRDGTKHGEVYLDSPASEASVFHRDSLIYCLPAATDKEGLTCLLLQAVLNGEYGVRYRRIGLSKISSNWKQDVKDIEDLVKPPGKADTTLGRYYYGLGGETTKQQICII